MTILVGSRRNIIENLCQFGCLFKPPGWPPGWPPEWYIVWYRMWLIDINLKCFFSSEEVVYKRRNGIKPKSNEDSC